MNALKIEENICVGLNFSFSLVIKGVKTKIAFLQDNSLYIVIKMKSCCPHKDFVAVVV
jgi:hypothetical protein